MRIANLDGRAVLLEPSADLSGPGMPAMDIAEASGNRLPSDPHQLLTVWDDLLEWAGGRDVSFGPAVPRSLLRAPSPTPRQVFGIGLNYDEHVNESKMGLPDSVTVFTKFPSSVTGPEAEVALPSGNVDWEVEIVVVIGRRAARVREEDAWQHVAGLTVGQDLSERVIQLAGPVPQFSMGKSFPGFSPMGPALVTPDELVNPDDLALGCSLGGETLQSGRSRDMIFSIPEIIAQLSAILPLLPGDVIFTGTPSGVGAAREPKRFLPVGSTLTSWVEGLGEMHNTFVAGPAHPSRAQRQDAIR